MSAAVSETETTDLATRPTFPPELVELAGRSIPTPLTEARDNLPVLLDALLEHGLLAPVDHYHGELADQAKRSTERARAACLREAYELGHEMLGGTPYDLSRYDSIRNLTWESTQKRAKELRVDIVHPAANELFVDIDTVAAMHVFDRNLEVLRRHVPVSKVEISVSKTGGDRHHLVVTLGVEVSELERIAMQAALGSDPMREMLSIARVYENQQHATVFYERKGVTRSPYAGPPQIVVEALPAVLAERTSESNTNVQGDKT